MGNSSDQNRKLVGLRYSDTDTWPAVVAYGSGKNAAKILEHAKELKIPISQSNGLASTFHQLSTASSGGEESADILIDALSFLYKLEDEFEP